MFLLSRLRRSLVLATVFSLFAVLAPVSAQAGETLYIVNKAAYHKDADIRPAIRNECKLEEKLPEHVQTYAKKEGFDKVELVKSAKGHAGMVLTIQITRAFAPGGGAWTGRKSVTAKGTLKRGKQVVGNFIAQRSSSKAYRGTCALLGRNAKVMGRDIAAWLKKPGKNGRLGES